MPNKLANKFFLPDAVDLPQLVTEAGHVIPFGQLVAIDIQNLSLEYETHAAWQATIGHSHAVATASVERAKVNLKREEARQYFECRTELERAGVIKPTKDAIDSRVMLDEKVVKMQDDLLDLEEKEAILDVARRAFDSRREMLISLGAHERADKVKTFRRID